MVQKALALCAGQVRIRVRGASVERFLNVCARGGIALHRTRRIDFGELEADLSVADFKRLMPLMGRTGCRVHVLARRGMPFYLRRLRGRYVLIAGVFLLAAMIYALTSCLWVIEIKADPGISTAALRAELARAGAYTGVSIRSLDETRIRHQVRANMENISFLALSRMGNMMTVEAYGGKETPKVVDERAVTGVVASHDGLITKMIVRGGEPLKRVGDVVQKGEMLVTALTPPTREEGTAHLAHGAATVLARTWREETSLRALTRTVKQYTGKKKTQFALVFGNKRINLYLGSGITAGTCDKIIEKSRLMLGKGTALPVSVVRQTYVFYDVETVTDTPEQVQQSMEEAARARLLAAMDQGNITVSVPTMRERDGAAELTLHADCTEQIGVEIVDETPLPAPEEQAAPEPPA